MKEKLNRRKMIQLSGLAMMSLSGFSAQGRIMNTQYDILIIGGGPAGLSAALAAGRGNRSILILDSGKPRNAPAAHMMNFPSREGTPPNEFRQLIRSDLKKYPKIEFRDHVVRDIHRVPGGFSVDGFFAKKILLAHGVRDILPDIPGVKELFGKSVFHCPYCHGYEYLNKPMGLIGNSDFTSHMTPLVRGLSKDVIVFTNGEVAPSLPGIKIYTNKIEALIHQGSKLLGVKLVGGETISRSYLYIRPGQELTTNLGVNLGCELTSSGHYKVNNLGQTSQIGIFAAGDVTAQGQSVLNACALGQMAGAGMNFEILNEK